MSFYGQFFYLVETLGGGGYRDNLMGRMKKLDPNKSDSLDHFEFVGWFVDKEASLDFT